MYFMKQKFLFVIVGLVFVSMTAWAQELPTLIQIHQAAGVSEYPISEVQKVSFANEDLLVSTSQGAFDHVLSAIQKITFAKKTTSLKDVQDAVCRVFAVADNLIAESNASIKRLQVINLAGQVVYNAAANQQRLQISTSTWSTGMYIVLTETEAGRNVQKVFVR